LKEQVVKLDAACEKIWFNSYLLEKEEYGEAHVWKDDQLL